MSFRIAVLVSGEGTNLQAILDSLHGREGVEVACVASGKPNARALERAQAAGVPTEVFEAAGYKSRARRDEALGDWIAAHDAQLIVLAGFMELLDPAFIRRFEHRILNVHPSLLPAFPGLRAIEQALDYGVRITGVTVHFVDEQMDAGPIVLQEAVELPYARAIDAIETRIHEIEHRLLPAAIRLIAAGALRVDPSNPRHVLIERDEIDVSH